MQKTAYSINYLRKHGKVTAYIEPPLDSDSEAIAQLSINIETPKDPRGKCAARLDIRLINAYKIGYFDSRQEISWTIGVSELRVLKAFPWLHDALICGTDNCLSMPEFLKKFTSSGGQLSKCFVSDYAAIKNRFDLSSNPTFEELYRPN